MKIGSGKPKVVLEEKVPSENLNSLRLVCEEFRRGDLYRPLSWILNLNIRWLDRNLEYFLKRGRYVLAANVMLYESKNERARDYLEKARRSVNVGSARHRRLTMVLDNLDIASKIARRYWELAGKYSAKTTGELFTRILVAVDGSKSAAKAVKVAVNFAKRNAAELIALSVISSPSYLYSSVPGVGPPPASFLKYYDYATKNAEKWVNEVAAKANKQGVRASGRVLKDASAVQSIVDFAEKHEVDLVVLGTRGSGGFKRLLLGSVSNGVVAHAHCSVLVVR